MATTKKVNGVWHTGPDGGSIDPAILEGKMDKVAGATAGNIAVLDSAGNVINSNLSAAAISALKTEVESFIGAQTNFLGIFADTASLPASPANPSWALVGADVDALNAYVYTTAWAMFGTKTYDFTDFDGVKDRLSSLEQKVDHYKVVTSDITNSYVEQKTLYYQPYTPTDIRWISNSEYYWRLYKIGAGKKIIFNKIKNRNSTYMAFECPLSNFVVGGSITQAIIPIDAPVGEYEYVNSGSEDKYVAILYKYYSSIYFEVKDVQITSLVDKINELDILTKASRESVFIKNTDTNAEILSKMMYAFNKGYCDVFWEKGDYDLLDFYTINTLDSQHQGLPIGNDCRYYFNGSTIKYELPSGSEYSRRHILDTQSTARNLEVHDVNLININGYYGIHDEEGGMNDAHPYIHIYSNVNIYCNNNVIEDTGWKPFGCGAGYDSTLIFRGCVFNRASAHDSEVAIHGVILEERTTPLKCNIVVENCWFQRSSFQISSHYFNPSIDQLDLRICGCSSAYAHIGGGFTAKMWQNEIRS